MNQSQYVDLYKDANADLARLELEIENVRRLCEFLREKAGLQPDNSGNVVIIQKPLTPPLVLPPKSRRFANAKQIDAAQTVVSEAGEPLKTREIAKRLLDGGFPSDDMGRLKTTLFTSMTRKPEVFEKVGAGLWTLVKTAK